MARRGEVVTDVAPTPDADALKAAADAGWAAWQATARREQLPPDGDWTTWLILAGRGFGKTRAGAEWLTGYALSKPERRLALVGPTAAAVAGVMVEGESGLLGVARAKHYEGLRPKFVRSAGRVEWPNGSVALCFSGHEADQVRGYQFHAAWCDELAHWPRPGDVWTNLRLSLRLGARPRALVTTTPKPLPLLRAMARDASGRVAVTRGGTRDNAANLPAEFVDEVYARYAGTATGRQELDGELLESVEGALWTQDAIHAGRADAKDLTPKGLRRVVVAVDPPAGDGTCGIVAAGLGGDGRAYVLGDRSVAGPPHGWARAVASAAAEFRADCVVAEVNNGGAMVRAVLEAVEAGLPLKEVHASHGKVVRAEPVAALYQARRVSHAGVFRELEAQMCAMTLGGGFVGGERSPDRADALVWALTELLLGGRTKSVPRVRALEFAAL